MENQNATTPVSTAELTSAQLEEKIIAIQSGSGNESVKPSDATQVSQPQTAPSSPATEVKATPQNHEQIPAETAKAVQVEQKSGESATFDALAQKKNIHNADELASMYSNLEKAYTKKAMEAAELRKQQVAQQLPTQQPPVQQQTYDPLETAKQKFLEDFATDPFNALQTFQQIVNKPIIMEQKKNQFNAKLVEMSNSPKTADFNTKEIQDKISEIVNERPEKYINTDGLINPSDLEDLYYLAKGRMSVGLNTNNGVAQSVQQSVAPVEGKAKATSTQTNVNPKDMTSEQLEAYILQMTRG